MFLSTLKFTRWGQHLALNPYALHQRLWGAFPREYPQRERTESTGFLFMAYKEVIKLQSAERPELDVAFELVRHFVEASSTEEYSLTFSSGQQLSFVLKAIPAVRPMSASRGHLCRMPLDEPEDQMEWLSKRAPSWGFDPIRYSCMSLPKHRSVKHVPKEQGRFDREIVRHDIVFSPVLYKGQLTVTDASRFREQVIRGFGSGKGMGFGLMLFPAQ